MADLLWDKEIKVTYKFESVDTSRIDLTPVDMASALYAGYVALAVSISESDPDVADKILINLDKVLEMNKEATCYNAVARLAQFTKFGLTAKK
ncbi:hypothetical protein [Yersinia frederiksenii]|uniref:hypothetical protein n=1 Tax=Yersinia frederiksenii TaxID=29484 RepID=UPI00067B649C|nr:hypothetical protein [Yersinia frederiksenii]